MSMLARRRWLSRLAPLGLLAGALLVAAPACKTTPRNDAPLAEDVELAELNPVQVEEVGKFVAETLAGGQPEAPAFLREGRGSAYVALRHQGKLLGDSWGDDGELARSLTTAIAKAKSAAGDATVDMVELNLAHTFHTVANPIKKEIFRFASGKRVGIRGIELTYGDHFLRVAPTTILAAGERFDPTVNRFLDKAGLTGKDKYDAFAKGGGKVRVFESQQLLVRIPSGEAIKLLRGNVYVEPSQVTQANTQATVDLLIEWMLTNLQDDGRMVYMWYPAISQEKPNDNNMIRQWMATNALIKVAEKRNDPALWDRIEKNIDYNLEHFYKQDGEFGLISNDNSVKLGSLSLAAMAIVNHPKRAKWKTQEHGLRRSVAELWRDDGSFECHWPATGKNDHNSNAQNFYPGETLLLWAQLYRESRDPELLRRYVHSFRYYKAWHLDPSDKERRRPSFTPWHTQAHYILWDALLNPPAAPATPPEGAPPAEGAPSAEGGEGETVAPTPEGWPVGTTPETPTEIKPEELVEFVFEMNDWLIENMEVWEESAFDDEKGRFHSRERDYGSPHASSTGVYIEGMIDAYAMAKATGDKKREARYALALSRAIRSVMQIQYVDDVDMYYVTDRVRTKGGLRTTVIRNEIRVDNVQHVLMGLLKVLDRFGAETYKTEP